MTTALPGGRSAVYGAAVRRSSRIRSSLPSPALVALARARLRRSLGGRLGVLGAALVTSYAAVLGVVLSVSGEPPAWSSILVTSVRWLLWLGVAPLCLAIANGRAARDRADGIEALAVLRGHPASELQTARLVAAIAEISRLIAVPTAVLCAFWTALSWPPTATIFALFAGLVGFSLFTGFLVGATADACSRLGGRRGRRLLLAVVLIPWVMADLGGGVSWSLPGLLELGLQTTADAASIDWGAS